MPGFNLMALLMVVAAVCSGIFAGAAIYINAVEHPARIKGGTALALTEWRPSYQRATLMQAPLAIVGGVAALGAWLAGAGRGWLVGGLLLVSVVPFTLLALMPTNRALSAPEAANDLPRAATLLVRWNRLHAVRSVLSAIAFVMFTWLLLGAGARVPGP
jgi:hypothetical protein